LHQRQEIDVKKYDKYLQPEMSRVDLWHIFSSVGQGGAIALSISPSQAWNYFARQSPAALNDWWEQFAYLKAGTYQLRIFYAKGSGGGDLCFNIYNTVGSVNVYSTSLILYDAAPQLNQVHAAAVTIPRDGFYQIRGDACGKQAASTGYTLNITLISLWRTGD
jgi:hypothetical protein